MRQTALPSATLFRQPTSWRVESGTRPVLGVESGTRPVLRGRFDSVADSDMFCILPVGGDGKCFGLGRMFAKHRMAYRHRDASCRKGDSPQTSLSAGHLEAGQSVRNLRWRSNSFASVSKFYMSHLRKDAESTIGSRRRRSVGDGSHWQWVHTYASTHAQRDMCEHRDACVHVLFLQACVGQHDMRDSALMSGSSAILRIPS